MTLLYDAVEKKKYDVRMLERNESRGVIKSEDKEAMIKSLPDDSENAEWANIEDLAVSDSSDPVNNGKVTHH